MLMTQEADIFAIDKNDQSVLCCAVVNNHLDVLQILLKDPRMKYVKTILQCKGHYRKVYFLMLLD